MKNNPKFVYDVSGHIIPWTVPPSSRVGGVSATTISNKSSESCTFLLIFFLTLIILLLCMLSAI